MQFLMIVSVFIMLQVSCKTRSQRPESDVKVGGGIVAPEEWAQHSVRLYENWCEATKRNGKVVPSLGVEVGSGSPLSNTHILTANHVASKSWAFTIGMGNPSVPKITTAIRNAIDNPELICTRSDNPLLTVPHYGANPSYFQQFYDSGEAFLVEKFTRDPAYEKIRTDQQLNFDDFKNSEKYKKSKDKKLAVFEFYARASAVDLRLIEVQRLPSGVVPVEIADFSTLTGAESFALAGHGFTTCASHGSKEQSQIVESNLPEGAMLGRFSLSKKVQVDELEVAVMLGTEALELLESQGKKKDEDPDVDFTCGGDSGAFNSSQIPSLNLPKLKLS